MMIKVPSSRVDFPGSNSVRKRAPLTAERKKGKEIRRHSPIALILNRFRLTGLAIFVQHPWAFA